MNAHPSESQLNEFVDGTLPPDEHSRVAGHLASCLPCAATVRRMEALIERARALPRHIAPPAGAWEDVRSAVRGRRAQSSPQAGRRARWALLAAAAALVIATSATTIWITRSDGDRSLRQVSRASAPAALASFAPVEARYVLTAAALEETLEERRPMLDPATVATVERSLTTIDAAIAEARAALANDPGNGTVFRLLASSYEQKVTLLRRASELPPRS